jgi:hypothetical protein
MIVFALIMTSVLQATSSLIMEIAADVAGIGERGHAQIFGSLDRLNVRVILKSAWNNPSGVSQAAIKLESKTVVFMSIKPKAP